MYFKKRMKLCFTFILLGVLACSFFAVNVTAADRYVCGNVYEWYFPPPALEGVYTKLYVLKFPDTNITEDDLKDTDYTDEDGFYYVDWDYWGDPGFYAVFLCWYLDGYQDIEYYEIPEEQSWMDMYMLPE